MKPHSPTKKKPVHSQLGRTPSEVALAVMKMVTESSRGSAPLEGLSTLDKLQNLRTDPAVEILHNTDWRVFFESLNSKPKASVVDFDSFYDDHIFHTKKAGSGRIMAPSPSRNRRQPGGINGTLEQTQLRLINSLETTSKRLIKRMEILWNELKIPTADREFYRKSLCSKTTVQQCQELARYISALKDHRKRTIRTLYSISVRETAVKRCVEFMESLDPQGYELESDPSKKNFLMVALRDVQESTHDVINAIRFWRSQLWRPLPFIYHGISYMTKMLDDIVYFDDQLLHGVLDPGLMACWHLVCNTTTPPDESIHEKIDPEVHGLFSGPFTSSGDLESAFKYLNEETLLQRSIEVEMKYLVKNNVFIPLIRYGAQASSAENSQMLDNSASFTNSVLAKESAQNSGDIVPQSGTLRINLDDSGMAADAVDKMSLVDKLRRDITGPSIRLLNGSMGKPGDSKPASRPTSATNRPVSASKKLSAVK